MNKRISNPMSFLLGSMLFLTSCNKDDNNIPAPTPKDPNTAEIVPIDRFSATAGHLQVRNATNGLPGPNVAVNFDQAPFITKGFTPNGLSVDYYNFDLQPTKPAPIWEFHKAGQETPVAGQLNVINVIPGEDQYNDFWQVFIVTVPENYVPNTVTSYSEIMEKGYTVAPTTKIVNCPVVPKNSTAAKRFNNNEDAGLTKGWYKGKLVFYFNFSEKALTVTANGDVPLSPIFVAFNINPNLPNGGPDSGFKMEAGSLQTHNVIGTIPSDPAYSPLWTVKAYDNASFGTVNNLTTALAAPVLVPDAGKVNCPVVKIQ